MSYERTLVLLKPDAVARGLAGAILARFERAGLTIERLDLRTPTADLIGAHYAEEPGWLRTVGEKTRTSFAALGLDLTQAFGSDDPMDTGRTVRSWLIRYMTSGPVVALVLGGEDAVKTVRKLVGATFPAEAAPGTIRGDYSIDTSAAAMRDARSVRNLVHASGTPEEGKTEIALWFGADA